MSSKRLLVLGSGGREHALVEHFRKHGLTVECAPGSDAISKLVPCWNFENFDDLQLRAEAKNINIIIVGPEKYLAEGITDFFEDKPIEVFGPSRACARLETDKAWAKDFCRRHKIPHARSETIRQVGEIDSHLAHFKAPYVVKASGLAAGKGVLITEDLAEAKQFAKVSLETHESVVLEEFLTGEEISCFYAIDGNHFSFLGCAQDHKRLLDDDRGPNTGGMGAVTRPPFVTDSLLEEIETKVIEPTLRGLGAESMRYRGFLFLGFIVEKTGRPKLLEYNCRMGDPETQVVLLNLRSSLMQLIEDLALGKACRSEIDNRIALNVVVAAKPYPETPKTGFSLPGLDSPPPQTQIFHSGTRLQNSTYVASGGRLFSIASVGSSVRECRERIYPWLEQLSFKDLVSFRKDIGAKYAKN